MRKDEGTIRNALQEERKMNRYLLRLISRHVRPEAGRLRKRKGKKARKNSNNTY